MKGQLLICIMGISLLLGCYPTDRISKMSSSEYRKTLLNVRGELREYPRDGTYQSGNDATNGIGEIVNTPGLLLKIDGRFEYVNGNWLNMLEKGAQIGDTYNFIIMKMHFIESGIVYYNLGAAEKDGKSTTKYMSKHFLFNNLECHISMKSI